MDTISNGQGLILLSRNGKKHTLTVTGESLKVSGLGVVDTGRLIGKPLGSPLEIAGVEFLPLIPSIRDRLETLNRKAQIIHAKDAVAIIHNCDIGPGSAVVEAGAGSQIGVRIEQPGAVRTEGAVDPAFDATDREKGASLAPYPVAR